MSPEVSRRSLLVRGTVIGSGAIGVMLSVPALGFLLSPLFSSRRVGWVTVGSIDAVEEDQPTPFTVGVPLGTGSEPNLTVARVVYVVRRGAEVIALSNTCSHMQCNVHWDRGLDQFLCPCHGGLYDRTGRNVGGPPPSPLPRWVSRVSRRGGSTVLEIQNQFDESI